MNSGGLMNRQPNNQHSQLYNQQQGQTSPYGGSSPSQSQSPSRSQSPSHGRGNQQQASPYLYGGQNSPSSYGGNSPSPYGGNSPSHGSNMNNMNNNGMNNNGMNNNGMNNNGMNNNGMNNNGMNNNGMNNNGMYNMQQGQQQYQQPHHPQMQNSSHSSLMTPTANANYEDASFSVLTFRCVRTSYATHAALDCEWKVQCGDTRPLHIKLQLERSIAWATRVRVTCNEDVLIPKPGPGRGGSQDYHQGIRAQHLGRMIEDFKHVWPFRGVVKGIGVPGYVEVRSFHQGVERWFPGTIKQQNANDTFDVVVQKHTGTSLQEETTTCHKVDLRESATRRPFERTIRNLVLLVPMNNPSIGAHLSIDEGKHVTHYFARPTPPAKLAKHMPKIVISVQQDRQHCSVNAGHMTLLNHVANQVKNVRNNIKRAGYLFGYGSKVWVIQICHAEHTIEVERKWRSTKAITVIVDGEIMVEACSEDIDCHKGIFECPFRFTGERVVEFDMFEMSPNGQPLTNKCREVQKRAISHVAKVTVKDFSDMSKCSLTVDGVDFRQLPLQQPVPANENNLSTAVMVLENQYDIVVPFKVNNNGTIGQLGYDTLHNKNQNQLGYNNLNNLQGQNNINNNSQSGYNHNNKFGHDNQSNYAGSSVRQDSQQASWQNAGYRQNRSAGSAYGIGSGYGGNAYGNQAYNPNSVPSMFERIVMCMCSRPEYDDDPSAASEFPPLLSWDTNSLAGPSVLNRNQDPGFSNWNTLDGQLSQSGVSSPNGSPKGQRRRGSMGGGGSGPAVMPGGRHDTPADWEGAPQGLSGMSGMNSPNMQGQPGSPNRQGQSGSSTGPGQGNRAGGRQGNSDQLSYVDLQAMGLSDEEIRAQLGAQSNSRPGSSNRARSGSPNANELSATELRAMGMSEQEIRAQLGGAGGDPQLSHSELRALGLSEEEIRLQMGANSPTQSRAGSRGPATGMAQPGSGGVAQPGGGGMSQPGGKGKGTGRGKGAAAQPGQPGQPGGAAAPMPHMAGMGLGNQGTPPGSPISPGQRPTSPAQGRAGLAGMDNQHPSQSSYGSGMVPSSHGGSERAGQAPFVV